MICEKCRKEMCHFIEGSTQGWRCPLCGWDIITTYIADIYTDLTEYSLYANRDADVNTDKIRLVAQIANVNFIVARQMLEESERCILKAKAPEIMKAIAKMQELDMGYVVTPSFKYS